MAKIELSARDIDHIARVVETEVSRGIQRADPAVYNDMVAAVVDTVTNRLATGRYGKTVQDVLNDRRAFSKITGPKSLDPYGSVQKAPAAPTSTRAVVAQHLADRAKGKPSIVGGALDYANPAHSSPNNISGWIDPMRAAGAVRLGIGKQEHYHGLAPHNIGRAAPDYEISVPEDVASMATGQYSQPSYPDNLTPTGGLTTSRVPSVAEVQRQAMAATSDQTIGSTAPALNSVTPYNAPLPGGLFDDPRNMRDISVGLLGGVAPPASRPGMPAPGMATPTARASNPNRPGLPTPMSRPSPSMAAPSVMSAAVQERMTGVPMSDRQITASIPDMPAASAMLSRTAPSMNPRSAMSRPDPSMMDRAAGLLSMDAKASTMPGSTPGGLLSPDDRIGQASMYGATGSWGQPQGATGTWDAPAPAPAPAPSRPNFAGPMGSPRAAGVPDYAPPAPPTNFAGPMGSPRAAGVPDYTPRELGRPQSPAFSTPMIDTLGHPPVPGLQRAPVSRQTTPVEDIGDIAPDYPAPRDIAPAPTIAGPVGRQRQVEAPERPNISGAADRNMAQVAASRALDTVADRGLFGGGFRGPTGVLGGAMLGGALGGIPGAAVGGLLGSETVRDALGLGGLERSGPHGSGQLSAGALAALNSGWGGFGNMTATQQLATSLARAQAEQKTQQARGGLFGGWDGWGDFEGFDGWGLSGNEASSSAINGRTTSYRDGRTSMGGEGGFGSGSMSDSARSSAKGGGGLF